jgi:hypothetical protein
MSRPLPRATAAQPYRLALLALSACLASLPHPAPAAWALSLAPTSDEALIRRGDLVVRGRVVAQRVTQEGVPEGRRWVFTQSDVAVEECVVARRGLGGGQGGRCPAQVTVSQIGGPLPPDPKAPEAPPVVLSIPGQPLLRAGARVTLVLRVKSPVKGDEGAGAGGAGAVAAQGVGGASAPPLVFVVEGGPLGAREWPEGQGGGGAALGAGGVSGAEGLEVAARKVAADFSADFSADVSVPGDSAGGVAP